MINDDHVVKHGQLELFGGLNRLDFNFVATVYDNFERRYCKNDLDL